MSTSKQDRKMARKFKNPVAHHMNMVNRAISHMSKKHKENSRKNKSWMDAI